jgi:hypothetical protein
MKKELKQKIFGEYRNYEIVPEGLKFETRTLGVYSQHTIKFETIGFDEHLVDYRLSKIIVALVVSVFLNFFFFLYLVIMAFPGAGTAAMCIGVSGFSVVLFIFAITYAILVAKNGFKVQKTKFIKGQVNIMFLYFERFQADVDTFIADLKIARRDYFRNKLLKFEVHEQAEFAKQKIAWLKGADYITTDEYMEWIGYIENRKIIEGN